jgi:hypothetical protein
VNNRRYVRKRKQCSQQREEISIGLETKWIRGKRKPRKDINGSRGRRNKLIEAWDSPCYSSQR